MSKEVYFLAKDTQADRFLIHKAVIDEAGNPKLVGYVATQPDAPDSDYKAVMGRVNTYRDMFENDTDALFYEGFSLWLIEYFEKNGKKSYTDLMDSIDDITIQAIKVKPL